MYDNEDRPATPMEAMREYAREVGAEKPQQAWILTDYDVWVKNPYYNGPEAPHPEDDWMHDDE